MIYYSKQYWGLEHLTRGYGSPFPRAFPFALLGTAFTAGLQYSLIQDRGYLSRASHPFPFSILTFAVAFVLTFRNNLAYNRFWEGRTQLQVMDSKWTDVVSQAISFDWGTLPEDCTRKDAKESKKFCETFCHLVSLLHALALQNLRRDWDLDNLERHSSADAPTMDILVRRRMKQQEIRSMMKEQGKSRWGRFWVYMWAGRHSFPTDLFHIRSNRLEREAYNHLSPFGVLGGISEEEKDFLGVSATLGPIGMRDNSLLLSSGSVRLTTGQAIPGPGERVHVVNDWIHTLIMERRKAGGLGIPAPLLTRMFSIMSQGMEGYENCRKLADTAFPFPYAQLVVGMLLMFCTVLPYLFGGFVRSNLLSIFLVFITLLTYFALNELAKGLEDPFIYDPNDLPLTRHHYDFNERLLAVARTKRPTSNRELSDFPLINAIKRADDYSTEREDILSSAEIDIDESRALHLSFTGGKLSYFLGGDGIFFRNRSSSSASPE